MAEAPKRRTRDQLTGTPSIISETSIFKGEFCGACDFLILGSVVGTCVLDSMLTVEKTGIWSGKITAKNVIINGTVKGDIVAKEKLEIGAHARIEGNVTAGSLAIATGAIIQGDTKITGISQNFNERRQD